MPYSEIGNDPSFADLYRHYLTHEATLTEGLAENVRLSEADRSAINAQAATLTSALLDDVKHLPMVDAFLREYSLSSQEGLLLMRLAESLIRTPDTDTAALLLRDTLMAGDWWAHSSARHPMVKLGSAGLSLCKSWVGASGGVAANHLLAKLGDRIMLAAVRSAIALLGRHFVLGTSIEAALRRGHNAAATGTTHSYDMLGEAAHTQADADRYFTAYQNALEALAKSPTAGGDLHAAPALSVKLSALHPRYEYHQRDRCVPALAKRLAALGARAKAANIGLTIDAEEADRLEVSLLVFAELLQNAELAGWDGLGLAVQAYQRRALPVIELVEDLARRHDRRITVRLVKGAYWDSEIKRAQELGLNSYPVFTRKEHTDISYLACARRLLEAGPTIYAQFATHNAHTAAAIVHMAGDRRDLEFQRLHGMSDGLHHRLAQNHGFATRTYAPVGEHKDLLPYLVRRLLENGANASFVNQLLAPDADLDTLIADPIETASVHGFSPHPSLCTPCDITLPERQVAPGVDLTQACIAASYERPRQKLQAAPGTSPDVEGAIGACSGSLWPMRPVSDRAQILRTAADLLIDERQYFMGLCVDEAGKSWPDAEAELREAVDFLRYYASQAEQPHMSGRAPIGIVACISPWNFPLAIFLGQVSAALSVGNTVIAKPAEQTPAIAIAAIELLHRAGVPQDALQILPGNGAMGAALVGAPDVRGVCFTGSTATAKKIAASLAETGRGAAPLIAETGGINAMIVDSTALLEQAVSDVIQSAFQSAGQRCSACRLVCVQDPVADAFIAMLSGAMQDFRTGDPGLFSTDIGPLIDTTARDAILSHIAEMRRNHSVIGEAPIPAGLEGAYLAPIAFELRNITDLTDEVFGPVLHLVRFRGEALPALVDEINALGFGLTMGLHTRVDHRVEQVLARAKTGNLYVNRNQIGAVVGQQPFGGEGLSGTGPKAGGPAYLLRLTQPSHDPASMAAFTPKSLLGPTGETNTIRYIPRGRLLCLGGDTPEDLARQEKRVRDTGNEPVRASGRDLKSNLLRTDIAGVVVEGRVREQVARHWAKRHGPILPLLSYRDDAERFLLERVVTIDTTAAGGNAALLAGMS
ncbi:MAG: L-glutamate gamma-semialdehyde dehydrogenase [Pseudomonadota bacterium]